MAKKRILLIDDVPLFLELEKSFFSREEFEVLTASNGREGLKMALAMQPDLVFMDLFMPEMNGDESCRLMKDDPALSDTPGVIVTQGGREEDLQRCLAAGCDDIVLKPVHRHDFLATARKFLRLADPTDPRVSAQICVYYGTDPQDPLIDYSHNLSTGGLFLRATEPFPVDTPLVMEFFLPSQDRSICCCGRVAWVNPPEQKPKPSLPSGMGVQFMQLDQSDARAIRDYILQR